MNPIFTRNLMVNRGTDYSFTAVLEDEQGNPVEGITSCKFVVRKHEDADKAYNFNCVYSDSTITVTATNIMTMTMPSGRYNYTLDYKNKHGQITRLMDGLLTVRETMMR